MSTPYEELWRKSNPSMELVPATYPTGLRYDGKAITYVDTRGGLLLVPSAQHDFAYSTRMRDAGLTAGEIRELEAQKGIYYPQTADLIVFPAILNAAANAEQGYEDVLYTVNATGYLLNRLKKQFGDLPSISCLDDIAVDRSTGSIELLAPFEVDGNLQPGDVFHRLLQDGTARSRNVSEQEMVQRCFALAHDAYTEGS
jgi:hypothetical protein